jgi:hypothetical protein
MKWHPLSGRDWIAAIGVGLGVSILTAAFMVATMKAGVSPLPKSLGLAFAETVLDRSLPLPIGLLFHIVWVTAFSVLFVGLFRDALTFLRALWVAIALWIFVLLVFFPVVGWGLFGLAISPKLIVGSAIPHLLFAIFLWGLCRWAFRDAQPQMLGFKNSGVAGKS